MPIALGIDFEDITHTPAYRSLSGQPEIDCDIIDVGQRLLSLFSRHDVQATFFIVSEIAEAHPEFIRQIDDEGHEIASHTVSHQSLTEISNEQLRSEIRDSKAQLEALSAGPVSGIRAPTCRISDEIYPLLAETGYDYSSTVMPSVPIPGFYSRDYDFSNVTEICCADRSITELPLSVHPHLKLPISGAWIRLLGRRYLLHSVRALVARGLPVVTYSHPWEFVGLQDSPLPFRCRVRTGEWLFEIYNELLQLDATFTTISEMLEQRDATNTHVID